jgi:hypothetical protein
MTEDTTAHTTPILPPVEMLAFASLVHYNASTKTGHENT